MTTNQLELGFNGTQTRIFGRRRAEPCARAGWWFSKMREAVANAMDWQSDDRSRPEQIWIPGASRGVKI